MTNEPKPKQKHCRICGKFLYRLTTVREGDPQWKCFNCVKNKETNKIYQENDWLNGNYHRAKINRGESSDV